MVQKSQTTTWDGHKTLKIMGIFTISTGDPRISEPSTVFSASFGIIFRDGGDKKGTKWLTEAAALRGKNVKDVSCGSGLAKWRWIW